MLNLTVDMMGQSVNLLEVGGRVQGLETLLQEYLASSSLFQDKKDKSSSPSNCVRQEKMDDMKKEVRYVYICDCLLLN